MKVLNKRFGVIHDLESSYSDSAAVVMTIALSSSEVNRFWPAAKKRLWRGGPLIRQLGAFADALVEAGLTRAPGCRCRHCQMDFDCCGNMVPGSPEIQRMSRNEFRVTQHYSRNI